LVRAGGSAPPPLLRNSVFRVGPTAAAEPGVAAALAVGGAAMTRRARIVVTRESRGRTGAGDDLLRKEGKDFCAAIACFAIGPTAPIAWPARAEKNARLPCLQVCVHHPHRTRRWAILLSPQWPTRRCAALCKRSRADYLRAPSMGAARHARRAGSRWRQFARLSQRLSRGELRPAVALTRTLPWRRLMLASRSCARPSMRRLRL
jgi:hypothetical protein